MSGRHAGPRSWLRRTDREVPAPEPEPLAYADHTTPMLRPRDVKNGGGNGGKTYTDPLPTRPWGLNTGEGSENTGEGPGK